MDTRVLRGPSVPRYIYPFDLRRQPHLDTDVVVVGSGSAGLSAALAAADAGAEVVLLSKATLNESNTTYAQGGVAAVLNEPLHEDGDSIAAHVSDTMTAGADMCDEAAVKDIIAGGNDVIEFLQQHHCAFDKNSDGQVALTREGGHSFRRILHANGDATGKEIVRSLSEAVEAHEHITILNGCYVLDLLDHNGTVVGVIYSRKGVRSAVVAKTTILATGGCGRVFRETSNPAIATGDGLAMAYRAGAHLCDMEFVQFHPTTLYIAGKPRYLITEAMRGEGAHLVNHRGERFMPEYHDLAELAPRDVVSRAIIKEISRTNFPHVWLDATHLPNDFVRERFPTIAETCQRLDIDITKDWIPVHPSAHYHCGGIISDTHGRSNLPGLLVAGEVACTGLHGANRLASNSILESLVMGLRAGRIAADSERPYERLRIQAEPPGHELEDIDISDMVRSARALLWRNAGIERSLDGLQTAINSLNFWLKHQVHGLFRDQQGWELQNILVVGNIIAHAALERRCSVGTHLREDSEGHIDYTHNCFVKPG